MSIETNKEKSRKRDKSFSLSKLTESGADHGAKPADPDLAKQAIPGHSVPSQDPDSEAQFGLTAEEAERESESVLVGGGLVTGLAAGAAVGAAVAGPVGILVGGTVGAVAGVVGSGTVGGLVSKKENHGKKRL